MTDDISSLVRQLNYDLKAIQDHEWLKNRIENRTYKFLYYDEDEHELRKIISSQPMNYDMRGIHVLDYDTEIAPSTLMIDGDVKIVKFLEFFEHYLMAISF